MGDQPSIDVNKLIDDHLAQREKKPRTIGRYSPSELPRCMRQIYYQFVSPKDVTPETRKVFAAGIMIDEFVSKVLRNAGFEAHREEMRIAVPLEYESSFIMISGRLDDYIVVKKDSQPIIIETKSTSSISPINGPKPEDVMQITPYIFVGTGSVDGEGQIVYVEKNTLRTVSYKIKFDPVIFKRMQDRARQLHTYLIKNKLPPPEAKLNPATRWRCDTRYCPYVAECTANQNFPPKPEEKKGGPIEVI